MKNQSHVMKIETSSENAMWSHIALTTFLKILELNYQTSSRVNINVKSKDKDFMVSIVIKKEHFTLKASFTEATIQQAANNCAHKLNTKLKKRLLQK